MSVALTILENAGRLIYHGVIGLVFLLCLIGAGSFIWLGWALLVDARNRRRDLSAAIAAGRVTPALAEYLKPEPWEPPTRERPALADDADESWAAIAAALSGPAPHEPSARERIRREAA